MLIKAKNLLAIKVILLFYILLIAQSCSDQQENKSSDTITEQEKNAVDSLITTNKVETIDKNTLIVDTLAIGDIHIEIKEANNFFDNFKKTPAKFYYSDIERRDFFLLHDQTAMKYYLFGAENGGCLSCVGYVEFINNVAFKKARLPEEIQDTVRFKPYKIAHLGYKILEYPFLNLNSNLSSIEKNLTQAGFKLINSKDKSKVYRKTTDNSITSVFISDNEVNRISIRLNIDVS